MAAPGSESSISRPWEREDCTRRRPRTVFLPTCVCPQLHGWTLDRGQHASFEAGTRHGRRHGIRLCALSKTRPEPASRSRRGHSRGALTSTHAIVNQKARCRAMHDAPGDSFSGRAKIARRAYVVTFPASWLDPGSSVLPQCHDSISRTKSEPRIQSLPCQFEQLRLRRERCTGR